MMNRNEARASGVANFYNLRRRLYLVLLLFVAAVGLPIIGVPDLRDRLQARVQTLREAAAGVSHRPLTQNVGENTEPFPSEYEHAFVPPRRDGGQPFGTYIPKLVYAPVIPDVPLPAPRRKLDIPIPRAEDDLTASADSVPGQDAESDTAKGNGGVQYLTGEVETEAYDLLKESSTTISGMVAGSNPMLHFDSWGAARMGDESFWVRLTFTRSPGTENEVYIWEVNLRTRKVTPLSFNARSLPKS